MSAGLVEKWKRRVKRASEKWNWIVRNRRARKLLRTAALPSAPPIADLSRFELKIFSQHGEDGILEAIFAKIGTTNKYCVEFGVGKGSECNTRNLVERKNWSGLWMTGNEFPAHRAHILKREFITAENINALFKKYNVPRDFDLLNIDIDGNDYWVWRQITDYRPRVVCMEYNAHIPPGEARAIEYDSKFIWGRTDYYGASLLALAQLGKKKGYELAGCDSSGTNAFFVQQELAAHFEIRPVAEVYRAGKKLRHDPRTMPVVGE